MAVDRAEPGSPSQWLDFARSDLVIARMKPELGVLLESLCYHAQQSAEKCVKAILLQYDIRFPRTHSLDTLLGLLPANCPRPPDEDGIRDLSGYAVEGRYPAGLEGVTPAQHRGPWRSRLLCSSGLSG